MGPLGAQDGATAVALPTPRNAPGDGLPGSRPQAGGFTNLSQMYYFGDKNEGAL